MTPDQIDLARRLVASPKWKWVPGMGVRRWSDYYVLWRTNRVSNLAERGTFWLAEGWLPDLNDPATLGCLLQLVREAWSDPEAHIALGAAGWVLMSGESRVADVVYPSPAGTTEAEALVAALEAAP